jgi:hypothetical protein
MVERVVLVDKQKLTYEGIFTVRDLYSIIDIFIQSKGYQKKEKISNEVVTKAGRKINHKYEISKQLSDFSKSIIQVNMLLEDVKDIEIKKEGVKTHANQGKVTFLLDAYLENDFEHRWENKPGFFFIRVLFDKYIFKPFTTDYQGFVMKDYKEFRNEVMGYLNLNKY